MCEINRLPGFHVADDIILPPFEPMELKEFKERVKGAEGVKGDCFLLGRLRSQGGLRRLFFRKVLPRTPLLLSTPFLTFRP